MNVGPFQVYEAIGPALEESLRLLAESSEPPKLTATVTSEVLGIWR